LSRLILSYISVSDQDDFSISFPQKVLHAQDKNSTTTILRVREKKAFLRILKKGHLTQKKIACVRI
jgi:hypothetical protein